MAKSNALSSLGNAARGMLSGGGARRAAAGGLGGFLTGGAGGAILGGLQGLLGPTGGGSSSTGGALGAFGRGALGSFGGGGGGGGSTFTKVIPGNPQAQPQQQFRRSSRSGGLGGMIQESLLPPRRPDSAKFSGGGSIGGGGGGLGGGGFAMDPRAINETIASYYAKQKEANEANEARYQQLLGIADATTGQRGKDITSDFANQQSMAMQNLASLGLANTSGASTIRGGFGRKKNEALDRLADTMQQTKLGIIERRTDAAPDIGSYIALAQLRGTAAGQAKAAIKTPLGPGRGRGYNL